MYLLVIVLAIIIGAVYITSVFIKRNKPEKNKRIDSPFSVVKSYFKPDYSSESTNIREEGTRILTTWFVYILNHKGHVLRTIPISIGGKEEYTIGRDADCDITITDNTVSGVHATIVSDDEKGCVIRDNDSTNGLVVVEGKQEHRYDEIPLSDLAEGTAVYLGNTPLAVMKANSRKELHIMKKQSLSVPDDDYSDDYSSAETHINIKKKKLSY